MRLSWELALEPNGIDFKVKINFEDGGHHTITVALPPNTGGVERDLLIRQAVNTVAIERKARLESRKLRAHFEDLKAKSDDERANTPPLLAELLISILAPKKTAQTQLGDLEEMFQKNATRYGEAQARRKYWREVARSLAPLLLQWGKRIGFFTVLFDYFRAKLGL